MIGEVVLFQTVCRIEIIFTIRTLELVLGLSMFFSCFLGAERLVTMRTHEWALSLWMLRLNMLSSRLFVLEWFITIATDPATNVSSYSAVRYHMRIYLEGGFACVTSWCHGEFVCDNTILKRLGRLR